MKSFPFVAVLLIAVFSLAADEKDEKAKKPILAEEQSTKHLPKASEPGFSSLLKDKDLSGWIVIGDKDGFIFDKGELLCDAKRTMFLLAKGSYPDFVLRYWIKYEKWDQSRLPVGVNFRAKPLWYMYIKDDKVIKDRLINVEGPLQLTHRKHAKTGIMPWCGGGFRAKPDTDALKAALNPDSQGWNLYEIFASGRKTIVRINGVKVIEHLDQRNRDADYYVSTGKTKIALHIPDGSKVRFRDIRIKPLKTKKEN
ncbi:MAG: DUF1080 domain-containing protein [Bacteroidetes bacterium]|nr:DUF1080 domain-containing protein [Bacteroidota bacterium]